MSKPVIQSVAIVVIDSAGRLLVVRRAEDDDNLPGLWGLPAASLRDGETPEDAAIRAGADKLGVGLKILRYMGEDTIDRGHAISHLRQYSAEIVSGHPSVPQDDHSVSQYADLRYTGDPTVLFASARRGSLCSRIYLRNINVPWEELAAHQ